LETIRIIYYTSDGNTPMPDGSNVLEGQAARDVAKQQVIGTGWQDTTDLVYREFRRPSPLGCGGKWEVLEERLAEIEEPHWTLVGQLWATLHDRAPRNEEAALDKEALPTCKDMCCTCTCPPEEDTHSPHCKCSCPECVDYDGEEEEEEEEEEECISNLHEAPIIKSRTIEISGASSHEEHSIQTSAQWRSLVHNTLKKCNMRANQAKLPESVLAAPLVIAL